MSGNRPAWRPTASRDRLQARAQLLGAVRTFFHERGVLEVETPYLSAGATPDPAIDSLKAASVASATPESPGLFLHTSPEFAMKRLLADGVGDIYQVARVFRGGECGRFHNPEFTLLEWYRVGYDHWRLMDEVADLIATLLPRVEAFTKVSYRELFQQVLGVDPIVSTATDLSAVARRSGIDVTGDLARQEWLDLLFTHRIEPELAGAAVFVHGFPAAQAALARLDPDDPAIARRFELFVDGVELANGFHELCDPDEQRLRFTGELERRRIAGLPAVPVDEHFLLALDAGLPDCAGVALGLDRLLMLMVGADRIEDVLAFPVDPA